MPPIPAMEPRGPPRLRGPKLAVDRAESLPEVGSCDTHRVHMVKCEEGSIKKKGGK